MPTMRTVWTDHGQMHLGRQIVGNVPTFVAPGTKSPYDEEWVVGASYEARPDLTVSLHGRFSPARPGA